MTLPTTHVHTRMLSKGSLERTGVVDACHVHLDGLLVDVVGVVEHEDDVTFLEASLVEGPDNLNEGAMT
ncbi:hypothetical protein VNO78_25131 [Psophocarpus tetragonolobus]|uniref:Uncharacterized protein n=1 Tax=Psophocarpus tetragonolobus TaxID=3891 RepID=A0AAN9XF53_PSOTE